MRPDRAADVRAGGLRAGAGAGPGAAGRTTAARSPARAGADNPVVFAGFVITNSETGCGAFTLTPRLVVQVCRNGMTITRDAIRAVHLGERLDEGVVTWSGNTQDKTLALITAKTTDAVAAFLDSGYVEPAVRRDRARRRAPAGRPARGGPDGQPAAAVHRRPAERHPHPLHPRRRRHRRRDACTRSTSVAQTLPDADAAHEMESAGAARPGHRRRSLTRPPFRLPARPARRGQPPFSTVFIGGRRDRATVTPLRPRAPSPSTPTPPR